MWWSTIFQVLFIIRDIINWFKNRGKAIYYGMFFKASWPPKAITCFLDTRAQLKSFLKNLDEGTTTDLGLVRDFIEPLDNFFSKAPIFDLLFLFVTNKRPEPLGDLKVRIKNMDIYHAHYAKGPKFNLINILEADRKRNQSIISGFDPILPKQEIRIEARGFIFGEHKVTNFPFGAIVEMEEERAEIIFKDGMAEYRKLKMLIYLFIKKVFKFRY